jgi:hypothetical protein
MDSFDKIEMLEKENKHLKTILEENEKLKKEIADFIRFSWFHSV